MGEFVATKLVEDTGGFAHVTAAGNARWASFAEAAAANDGVAGILHGGCRSWDLVSRLISKVPLVISTYNPN